MKSKLEVEILKISNTLNNMPDKTNLEYKLWSLMASVEIERLLLLLIKRIVFLYSLFFCFLLSRYLSQELIDLYYSPLDSSLAEWEYQPPIGPRPQNGFVGLKNAGATCYMNSVLQQVSVYVRFFLTI